MWYVIRTKFHEDLFGNLSNIKIIASKIWDAAMLVLLTEGIYDMRGSDGIRRHDNLTKIHEDRFGCSKVIWTGIDMLPFFFFKIRKVG
jgi:hypothetical protein